MSRRVKSNLKEAGLAEFSPASFVRWCYEEREGGTLTRPVADLSQRER